MGEEALEEEGMVWVVRASIDEEGTRVVTWEQVKLLASADETCRGLIQTIINEFLEQRSMVGDSLKQLFGMKEELYEVEEVPFLHGKMLVPAGLRA